MVQINPDTVIIPYVYVFLKPEVIFHGITGVYKTYENQVGVFEIQKRKSNLYNQSAFNVEEFTWAKFT